MTAMNLRAILRGTIAIHPWSRDRTRIGLGDLKWLIYKRVAVRPHVHRTALPYLRPYSLFSQLPGEGG